MDLIKKANVTAPTVPQEQIDVPELGGAVIVRGMLLSERMAFSTWRTKAATPAPGETKESAEERVGPQTFARMLSVAVVDADQQPVFDASQWERFGANHGARAMELFNAAFRLSGFDEEETAKN